MPWVRFTADFDYKPRPAVTIGYLAGMVLNVPTPAARAAIAAGKAVALRKPSRNDDPVEVTGDGA